MNVEIRTRFLRGCHYSFGPGPWPAYCGRAAGWFRLFGWGLKWRLNDRRWSTWRYFSERHGYTKTIRIGRLVIGILTPASDRKAGAD